MSLFVIKPPIFTGLAKTGSSRHGPRGGNWVVSNVPCYYG